MTDELPRLIERPHGSRLVTRTEAAELLGYSPTSMATVMGRDPQRWPRAVALERHGRVWRMLWDADELLSAAPPASTIERRGGTATISDADGLLTCLECGRRFRSLGRHLQAAHDLGAGEYRQRHHLPATGALSADGVREGQSERQQDRLTDDPDAFAHLEPYQQHEHLNQLRAAAIESHRSTVGSQLVRAHRLPGQHYAVQVMLARRWERLEGLARAAGFQSLGAAIQETADLSAAAAARHIGIAASTVTRWRAKLNADDLR